MSKNILWSLSGNSIYNIGQALAFVLLSKLGNPSIVGLFGYGFAITIPVYSLTNSSLKQVYASDVFCRERASLYFMARWISTVFAWVILLFVAIFAGSKGGSRNIILLVSAYKTMETFGDIVSGYYVRVEKFEIMSLSISLKSILGLLAIVLAMVYTHSLPIALAGMCFVMLMVFLFVDVLCLDSREFGELKYFLKAVVSDWKAYLKALAIIKEHLNLGVTACLMLFNLYIPRYVLSYYGGFTNHGYYTAIINLYALFGMVTHSIGFGALPKIAKYHQINRKVYLLILRKILKIITIMWFVISVFMMIFSRKVLNFVYGPEYSAYSGILRILALGFGASILNAVMAFVLIGIKKYKHLLNAALLSSLVTCAVSLLIIPKLGITGAAIANVVGSVVMSCVVLVGVYGR